MQYSSFYSWYHPFPKGALKGGVANHGGGAERNATKNTMFTRTWPRGKSASLKSRALLKDITVLIKHPFFLSTKKTHEYQPGYIFTTLPLEDAQGLHLVLKDGSSYMTAISKGQDTHTEKPSFSLTFSKHTVAMRHLAPTTVPPKTPNGCQFPCAFTRRILEKAVLCRRIPLWLGWSSKVYCLPMDS